MSNVKKYFDRINVLINRKQRLEIIQKDIYPDQFNRITKLINVLDKKIKIMQRLIYK